MGSKSYFFTFFIILYFFQSLYSENQTPWCHYDQATRTVNWRITPEKQVFWVYDEVGNRTEINDWSGTNLYKHDNSHRIIESVTPTGKKKSYTYDSYGALSSITYPGGEKIEYAYSHETLEYILVNKKEISFEYDTKRNLLIKKRLPNGIETEYQYDDSKRLTNVIHRDGNTLLAHYYFEYDAMNNITLRRKTTPTEKKTIKYKYDKLYRLLEASSSDGTFEKYAYDSLGNRLTKETQKGITNYTYNASNQLLKANDTTFSYDSGGNLIKKSSPNKNSEYFYNEMHLLMGYKDEKNTIEFTYNSQGERLSKTVNGKTTEYSYEDIFQISSLIAEDSKSHNRQYFYAKTITGYVENGETYYFLEESFANPISMIVDGEGQIIEELEYDSYGNCSSHPISLQYSGEQVDSETGLIFLRTRYYDPSIGRLLTKDCFLGDPSNPQSLNRYIYVYNNPINLRDPRGTSPETSKNPLETYYWSIGVPIWQEGDQPPPEGYTLVSVCSRPVGVFENNPMKNNVFRDLDSMGGHVYMEYVDSKGSITSRSAFKGKNHQDNQNKDNPFRDVATTDSEKYRYDKSIRRFGMIVPNEQAEMMKSASVEHIVNNGYNLFACNCIHTTNAGASFTTLKDLFYTLKRNHLEAEPTLQKMPYITPSGVRGAIDKKINQAMGWDHPFITPPPEVKNEILWMHLASDDAYTPSVFASKQKFSLESQFLQPSNPRPQRGNFGGICFSKKAELNLDLKEIYGAVFDEITGQLFLFGKKSIKLPEMPVDHLAVAVQSLYGLKGNKPENPGVSIDFHNDDQMSVKYSGATYGTEFGKILFEGDFTLKMLTLGLYQCNVPGFSSYTVKLISLQDPLTDVTVRTYIAPEQISLIQSADGSSMVFDKVKMRCLAETKKGNQIYSYAPFTEWAEYFTNNYDSIAMQYPIFQQVKLLGQITGVVKWIKENHIPFDLQFFTNYSPIPHETPSHTKLRKLFYNPNSHLSGGISFFLNQHNFSIRQNNEVDSYKKAAIYSRPSEKEFSWEMVDQSNNSISVKALECLKTRKVGNFRKTFVDLEHPAPGEFPITLFRFYDSFNDRDTGLGIGWSITPFDLVVSRRFEMIKTEIEFEGYPILLVREGNQDWIYNVVDIHFDGKIWYKREDGLQTLSANPDGSFSLYLEQGAVVFFNENKQLSSIFDRNRIETNYLYKDERLIEIRHQNGKHIKLEYDDTGRLIQASDSAENTIRYKYNSQKQISHVCDERDNELYSYFYDIDYRLTKIMDHNENILFEGVYDEYNRLSTILIGENEWEKDYSIAKRTEILSLKDGLNMENTYDANFHKISSKIDNKTLFEASFQNNRWIETTFTFEGKEDWKYKYGKNGLLYSTTDPLGSVWEFFYDENNNLMVKKDPKGDCTFYEYDNKKRLIARHDHAVLELDPISGDCKYLHAPIITNFHYNRLGRLGQIWKEDQATIFYYDDNGILTGIVFPSGYEINFEIDEKFQVKSIRDAKDVLQEFSYNPKDNTHTITSPSGIMEYLYNTEGNIYKIIDRCGNITEFEYDSHGILVAVKDAEGIVTRYD